MSEHDWILVGIDGSDAGRAAIRYGAEEARRLGATLVLAHVTPDYAPPSTRPPMDYYPVSTAASHRVGRTILAAAEEEAQGLIDPAQVETLLLTGYRVPALVQAAADARLVVLGDEPRPILERIATASVLTGVAAHAPVPVVAVPANWAPRSERPRVVAAVKDLRKGRGLVRRALHEAEERKAELVLLHAWQMPTAYDGVVFAGLDASEWEREGREALEQLVQALPAPSAEVKVRVDVRRGQPARVLVDASQDADLLVIARRPHGFPLGHLGGTGRAVLRASHCPVEVTPPATEPVAPEES